MTKTWIHAKYSICGYMSTLNCLHSGVPKDHTKWIKRIHYRYDNTYLKLISTQYDTQLWISKPVLELATFFFVKI